MQWHWDVFFIILFLIILILALIFHWGCNILSGHKSEEKEIIREDEFGRRI